MPRLLTLFLLTAVTGAPFHPPAALAAPRTVERVVAVVNDEPILASEIDEQLALLVASRRVDLGDTSVVAEARREILAQLVEERLIIDHAGKNGITVTDDQIEPQVQASIDEVKARVGSDEKFSEELAREGMTIETLRERYRQDMRKEAMAQRIIEREVRSQVKVTDTDIDTFFKNNKDQLPVKPATYDLAHILVIPRPDESRRSAARARAEKALKRLDSGETWEKVVAEVSEDPSSAANGGMLGEASVGDFDPAFEAAIADLEPGQRTRVVETNAGFHLIELVSRQGITYRARHILLLAQPSPEDVGKAIDRAGKIRAEAKAGGDWAAIVRANSDDPGTREMEGKLGEVPASRLGRSYIEALDSLQVGGVSEVIQGPTGFHIFKLLGRSEGGEYEFSAIREQLMNMLTQRKLAEAYEKWITDLRKNAYIEFKTL
ncbi:MAG: peptidylprolyl isomerase [Candidatus Eisenbacteria bacterium]|nr:peptidylprolyl isomerase [Candidatus Eisenbacteria bacterium]